GSKSPLSERRTATSTSATPLSSRMVSCESSSTRGPSSPGVSAHAANTANNTRAPARASRRAGARVLLRNDNSAAVAERIHVRGDLPHLLIAELDTAHGRHRGRMLHRRRHTVADDLHDALERAVRVDPCIV